MGGIKGFKSQKILKNKLAGYSETDSVDIERYVTVQEMTADRHGIDTINHGVYVVSSGLTAIAGSSIRVLNIPAHGAKKGDFVKFADGTEAAILSVPNVDKIILGSELSFDPTGYVVSIMRAVTPLHDSTGALIVGANPAAFHKNGSIVNVTEDTATPANNDPMPSGLMIKKDGVYVPVELDTTNPYSHTPIPVAITDVTGSTNVNITAGDINVSIKHNGVDPSSVRIGDGTNLAGVNSSNELKVTDATAQYLLSQMATYTVTNNDVLGAQIVGNRNNQIEINFETVPSSALLTQTTTSTGTITASNELKVTDATAQYLLSQMATYTVTNNDVLGAQIVGNRNNQIEVNFETVPSSALLTQTTTSTGTITASNGHTAFSTGAGVSSSAKGISVNTVTYRPAAEVYSVFTASFTAPSSANSYQRIGIYDTNNGFFIGYNGLNFGITRRVSATDYFTAKSSFSNDPLDGSANSKFTRNGAPEAINLTYSNLYRIRFAWLGSASILFDVFSPDGFWINFHTIKMPNSQVNPSIANPNLPMTVDVSKSAADATVLTVYTACWGAGTTSSYAGITETLSDTSLAATTRSVITGHTTAGGGGYVNVKVNPSGALTVDATVSSSVLPTGAATSALQTTGNASLSSIDANTGLMVTYGATSANQVTGNNSLSSIDTKLTSQATAANQTTGNASLSSIDTKLTSQATAANQATEIASLSSIDTKLSSQATATKQDTGNTSLASIDTKVGTTNTALGAPTDAVATSDTGTFSLIALIKRGLQWLNAISTSANLIATYTQNLSTGKAQANAPVRNDYTSVNVTTAAYTQLVASLTATTTEIEIFDSSGQTMALATGAAGAEVIQMYIFPGGNGRIPLKIAAGARISIKAISATASVGEIDINFYN